MNLTLVSPTPAILQPSAHTEQESRLSRHIAARSIASTPRNAISAVAADACLSDLLNLLDPVHTSQPAQATADAAEPMRLWRVRSGATLVHEGTATPWLYFIRSGSFKTLRTSEDGYQQVLSMLLPGDMLGFEILCCEQQPASAVALEDATVFAITITELAQLEQRHRAFDLAVQRALTRQLVRSAELAEVMSPVAAEARVARFLLWLSMRMAARGESPRRLRLRLCRRDVASLLGLAHETVSRAFTTLSGSGCLQVDNRDIDIIDQKQLRIRARHTRGLPDDGPLSPAHRPAQACAAA